MEEYQRWISEFYRKRKWYHYDPFIRANFLTEEVGEVSRAIRALEIGRDRPDEQMVDYPTLIDNLTEELGDVLDNLLIIADKYGIPFQEIMETHKEKLEKRYKDSDTPVESQKEDSSDALKYITRNAEYQIL